MPVSRHVSSQTIFNKYRLSLSVAKLGVYALPTDQTTPAPKGEKKKTPQHYCGSHVYEADRDARLNFLEW